MLPSEGYVRISQIVNNREKGTVGVIPVCAATWWNGVRSGKYPKPVKLGPRTTAWKVEDIRALVKQMGAAQ